MWSTLAGGRLAGVVEESFRHPTVEPEIIIYALNLMLRAHNDSIHSCKEDEKTGTSDHRMTRFVLSTIQRVDGNTMEIASFKKLIRKKKSHGFRNVKWIKVLNVETGGDMWLYFKRKFRK